MGATLMPQFMKFFRQVVDRVPHSRVARCAQAPGTATAGGRHEKSPVLV